MGDVWKISNQSLLTWWYYEVTLSRSISYGSLVVLMTQWTNKRAGQILCVDTMFDQLSYDIIWAMIIRTSPLSLYSPSTQQSKADFVFQKLSAAAKKILQCPWQQIVFALAANGWLHTKTLQFFFAIHKQHSTSQKTCFKWDHGLHCQIFYLNIAGACSVFFCFYSPSVLHSSRYQNEIQTCVWLPASLYKTITWWPLMLQPVTAFFT